MNQTEVVGKVWFSIEKNSAGSFDVIRYEARLAAAIHLGQCSTEIAWGMDEERARLVRDRYAANEGMIIP